MIFSDMEDNEVFNIIKDEKLISATIESYETGKITPLLKEELKCRILSRCLEEGKDLSPEPIPENQIVKDKVGRSHYVNFLKVVKFYAHRGCSCYDWDFKIQICLFCFSFIFK